MPEPTAPTVDVPPTPLDPFYIPFTTADPDGSEITIEDYPEKETRQYRELLEQLRVHLLAGDVLTNEAYAFAITTTLFDEMESWIVTDAGVPTSFTAVDGGSQEIDCTWVKPADEGTAGTITGYLITYIDQAVPLVTNTAEGPINDETELARTFSPIGAAGTYDVTIAAINEKGVSVNTVTVTGVVVA